MRAPRTFAETGASRPLIKIINVVGARPNLMKIAPLCRAMTAHPRMQSLLVHTGQHYDDNLSRIFFDELGIPAPDRYLGIGSGTRDEQIARIMEAFRPVVRETRPDVVLVVGDVNSTVACARVAAELGVAVAHVEAGLRSFDRGMPEELNREETDAIADYLFVTERSGMENLASERVRGRAWLVGNVMIDTLVANLERARRSPVRAKLGLAERDFAVGTFHRPSNVDEAAPLRALLDTIEAVCERIPLVLPLHPRTRRSLERHDLGARLESITGLVAVEPLGYLDFLDLVSHARVVITDSGGIQEETTWLRVPCLTLRRNTERPITVSEGSNVLVGDDRARLLAELDKVIAGTFKRGGRPELWDGHAATRIVDILAAEIPDPAVPVAGDGADA